MEPVVPHGDLAPPKWTGGMDLGGKIWSIETMGIFAHFLGEQLVGEVENGPFSMDWNFPSHFFVKKITKVVRFFYGKIND